MPLSRLLAISVNALLLGGCTQEGHLLDILARALSSDGEVKIETSCTAFLGFGPAVAIFQVSPGLAEEAVSLTGRFAENWAWSHHESMNDFHKKRGVRTVGIGATLLDGKDCLKKLTANADALLFDKMPGAYFASPDEEVVIVLFSEPQGRGAIFVQAP
ncbi:hypothetical protein GEU84_020795 [Fertoebacter nigrum]|uniref:Uncharacterized protein n=1 Tax=Fertoeibacter niger TaxID=2656921 RepID=A0A8X8H3T1_9RHOB|nr:hypothetical protein [Fertoeibacter niger]NUB46826.1 hypothetical protein [Fertoeibacter niger]